MIIPRPTVGVILITHNSKEHLASSLSPLINSPLNPRILVVNSSSKDGTVEMAKELGAEVLVIPRVDFNHGTTRELARKHLQTDIVVMMTPDAYFIDTLALGKLIDPIVKGEAHAAYARQLPHLNAGFFEAFPRTFNYPEKSHIRSLSDVSRYGIYTYFLSNSCAAYSSKALDEIGGFSPVLLGEDTVAAASLLRRGHKIAYVAEAEVRHSHTYSLKEEFYRSFDTGLARKEAASLLTAEGGDQKRGLAYAKEMGLRLLKEAPAHIPYGFAHLLTKWLGYQIGQRSLSAPLWFKKALSSQSFYWTSTAFTQKN